MDNFGKKLLEIIKPTKEDIKSFIEKQYPIQIGDRVFKDFTSVIEFYKSKIDDGFFISDDEYRNKVLKQLDEYWQNVAFHINEKYRNDSNAIIDGLTMGQYTELCIEKNKKFINDSEFSTDNPFSNEHKELVELINSNDNDQIKVEKLKNLFDRCSAKYKNIKPL